MRRGASKRDGTESRKREKVLDKEQLKIEGRNAVIAALKAGRDFEKILIRADLKDAALTEIKSLAKDRGVKISFEEKERFQKLQETPNAQGVIAYLSAFSYAEVEDILADAQKKNEDPFLILLDGIEDPHNLGAIIRTANQAGAHGVIIPKNRAAGLTATVAKTSAGALLYTKVARVTNLVKTMEALKKQGVWFVSADMDGDLMYRLDLKGPIGLVIGNEGAGVSRLVRENCDLSARIPMKGDIDSLNASVAAGILMYEIVRQRG